MKSFDGYLKLKLGNDYVLLAGGSHKALSDFLMASVAANTYVKKTGDTMTGDLIVNNKVKATSSFTFNNDPTGYDYGGLYRNNQITSGGTDTDMWLYSYNRIRISASDIVMNHLKVLDVINIERNANAAIITNKYNNTTYNLIRNHNNGNISISASSGSLYLGYENTLNIYCRGNYINIDSGNYTDYVYSKTTSDNRYVLKTGDEMSGTLSVKVTGYAYRWGNNNQFRIGSNSDTDFYLTGEAGSTADFKLYTSSTLRMIVKGEGNVGIGTAGPIAKLDVRGNIRLGTPGGIGDIGVPYNDSDTTAYNRIIFKSSKGANDIADINYVAGIWTSGKHLAHVFSVNRNDYALVIRNIDGCVGINTNSPRTTLDVGGLNGSLIIGKTNYSPGNSAANKFRLGLATAGHSGSEYWSFWVDDTTSESYLRFGYTHNAAQYFSMASAGYIYATNSMSAKGFCHNDHNNNDSVLLAGGSYRAITAWDSRYIPEPTRDGGNQASVYSFRTYHTSTETGINMRRGTTEKSWFGTYDDNAYIYNAGGYFRVWTSGKFTYLGNAGIGTESPATKLDVRGDITLGTPGNSGTIGCAYATNDTNKYNYIRFNGANSSGDIEYVAGTWTGGNHVGHIFKTNTLDTAMVIMSRSGRVGIATSSPRSLLDVYGTGASVIIGKTAGGGGLSGRVSLRLGLATSGHTGSEYWAFWIDDLTSDSWLRIGYNYNSSPYFGIKHDATVYAPAYYTTSDARKKQNIHKISDNIKQFEWKETGETSYGFVAQDLEVKHPELVNDDGNMKTVNYNAALSLVVAKLENRVKELEAKLGLETPPPVFNLG